MIFEVGRYAVRILIALVFAGASPLEAAQSSPLSSTDEQSAELCAANLYKIFDATQAYQRAHGELPSRLSDLAGKWLDPAVLVCPVSRSVRAVNLAQKGLLNWLPDDPLTSYKWEFYPSTESLMANGRLARGAVRKTPVGEWAPMVRCDHHRGVPREDHLNLAFNGSVYRSARMWEECFVEVMPSPYLHPRMLGRDVRPLRERLPKRDPRQTAAQIDLTHHWNCLLDDPWFDGYGEDTLEGLQARGTNGLVTLSGLKFDLRGNIQLDGWIVGKEPARNVKVIAPYKQEEAFLALPYGQYPTAVRNIEIGRAGERISFLCGGIYPSPVGTEIARVVVHYADSNTAVIPVVYGVDCVDGWYDPDASELRASIKAACVYEAPRGMVTYHAFDHDFQRIGGILVFLKSWVNPFPTVRIDRIDFLSSAVGEAPAPTCPFILGINVE